MLLRRPALVPVQPVEQRREDVDVAVLAHERILVAVVGEHVLLVQAGSRAMAQLWIESPLDYPADQEGNRRSWLNRAFDTHPPIEERIALLREL